MCTDIPPAPRRYAPESHLADLTFKQVNATVDLHSSDVTQIRSKYPVLLERLGIHDC